MTPFDGLILIFGGFVFFLLVLAVPVPYALGLTALVAMAASGRVPLAAVPIKMVNSMDSFLLIAVPFFILSAELLNTSQITMRIFRFADSLVGHVRGGLGHVNRHRQHDLLGHERFGGRRRGRHGRHRSEGDARREV
jgi:TRAP-type mannitol/chloroaromatic compound transport system permease large subunit